MPFFFLGDVPSLAEPAWIRSDWHRFSHAHFLKIVNRLYSFGMSAKSSLTRFAPIATLCSRPIATLCSRPMRDHDQPATTRAVGIFSLSRSISDATIAASADVIVSPTGEIPTIPSIRFVFALMTRTITIQCNRVADKVCLKWKINWPQPVDWKR